MSMEKEQSMLLSPDTLSLIRREISASLHCALPGIVRSFDSATQTVTVQPALRMRFGEETLRLPLLREVPIVFPSAGGYSFLAAPQAGDECLVIFADGAMDRWMASGAESVPPVDRHHDLSDGFAILGCWSQPKKKPTFPSSGCVIQKDDGSAGVSVNGNAVRVFGTQITLEGSNVDINGTLKINGQKYVDHKHSGVYTGSDATGGVVGA